MCDADETLLAKVRMLEEELLIETLKPFNGEPWLEALVVGWRSPCV